MSSRAPALELHLYKTFPDSKLITFLVSPSAFETIILDSFSVFTRCFGFVMRERGGRLGVADAGNLGEMHP